jgi:transcriptional regulator with XRE-family HTH domain
MDEKQAKELGEKLRNRREDLGLSAREVADRAGTTHSTVVRLEQGAIDGPAPDKLSRIAGVLHLSLADVFALADYVVPGELPTFTPYLRAKYRSLPKNAVADLERYFARLAAKYGIDPAGPAPGEDEAEDQPRRKVR